MIYRLRKDLANHLRSPKLWVGLLIGLAGFLTEISDLYKAVRGSENGVYIFEPYAFGSANSWTITVSTAGLVFSLSDMPYLTPFEMNAIYRSTKLKRILEKFLFSAVCTALFFFLQFVLTALITLPICYTDNVWSFFSSTIGNGSKSAFTPAAAALLSLLLNFAYGLMMIGVLFFLSLFLEKGAAYTIVFAFQAIQHFLLARMRSFSYFCVFRNSILEYYNGFDKRIIINLGIEFTVICAALAGSILIRNKIAFDVKTGDL